jgi:hypothetical protein
LEDNPREELMEYDDSDEWYNIDESEADVWVTMVPM